MRARDFLWLLLAAALHAAGSGVVKATDEEWMRSARIAGAAVYRNMEEANIGKLLAQLADQRVNVIEADSELSNYLTDGQFDDELATIRRFADAAHRWGMRVVWYYPVLEVISPNATTTGRSIFKDHPDWVQVGIDGSPNVFYGGEARVHWVDAGAESAWMTFESPYGDYFLDRIKRLAATGIDGIWLDVPLLNDIQVEWADMNPHSIAAFEAETGLEAPNKVDWSNPTWRRWIGWRHTQIAGFLQRIAEAAKSVSEGIAVIVENVTLDNVSGTLLGLDGSYLKESADLFQVWEIDALSDEDAMRRATRDDWVALVSMNKFARGASGDKPSWVFTYGFKADDADLVMAEAIATGNHAYETRIPAMTTSVGADYRKRMFSWIKENSERLFDSASAARTAVLFSSESRDYVDRGEAHGLYATVKEDDQLWWSDYAGDSFREMDYMAEYRGVVKWLLDAHVPFDILVDPSPEELAAYKAVIAPRLTAVSDDLSKRLEDFVSGGGILTLTGPNPTGLDEYGEERKTFALGQILKRGKNGKLPWRTKRNVSKGTVIHYPGLIGKLYLKDGSVDAANALAVGVPKEVRQAIVVEAPPEVHLEARRTAGELLLHFINGPGADGPAAVKPVKLQVALDDDEGEIISVELTSPIDSSTGPRAIEWRRGKGRTSFEIDLERYAMAIVRYGDPADDANDPPVAGDDAFHAVAGIPLELSPAMVLANDGDLDGRVLRITHITPTEGSVGQLVATSSGGFVYMPPDHLLDRDEFRYMIEDEQGSEASASIVFDVGPPAFSYRPTWAVSMKGRHDAGSFTSLAHPDNDTFDIEAVAEGGRAATEMVAGAWINDPLDNIDRMKVTVTGQFSRNGIEQTTSLYNFKMQEWDPFDVRRVGTGDDTTISIELADAIADYISPESEVRVRVEGRDGKGKFVAWTNEIRWDVMMTP